MFHKTSIPKERERERERKKFNYKVYYVAEEKDWEK